MPTIRQLIVNLNCIRGRSLLGSGWLTVCAFLVAWMASGLNATAAGCHYGALKAVELHEGGQPGKLAQTTWWSTAKVRCVYESGKLNYFQVPSGSVPCNGPGCRGKSPDNHMQAPVVIELQRQSFFDVMPLRLPHGVCPPMAMVAHESVLHSSPALSGLFRPPRPVRVFVVELAKVPSLSASS